MEPGAPGAAGAVRSPGPDQARGSIRLLLVDDHTLVRLGLRALFEAVPHFTVVGEAATAASAAVAARRWEPDVVVMDVRLPDRSGVEACREIRATRPETRVLMLTTYDDETAATAAVAAGAAGFVLKHTEPDRLVDAVELVARGGSLLDPAVAGAVLERFRQLADHAPPDVADPLAQLSEQQRRILPLIAEGKTNREIAYALHLSEQTVKTYVSAILQKLGLRRRAEAAALAARLTS